MVLLLLEQYMENQKPPVLPLAVIISKQISTCRANRDLASRTLAAALILRLDVLNR